MKKLLPAVVVLSLVGAASAQTKQPIEVGAGVGYAGGLTGELTVHAPSVIGGVGVRGDVSYTGLSTPLKDVVQGNTASGSNITMGLGATYPVMSDANTGLNAYVHGGVRYSIAKATETTPDKKAASHSKNGFGIGGGVQVSYPIMSGLQATADLGVDHIFPADINVTEVGGNVKQYKPGAGDYEKAKFYSAGTNFKARIGVKTSF